MSHTCVEDAQLTLCPGGVSATTDIELQKQPGGLFSARVVACIWKNYICCEQEENVEISIFLKR